MLALLLDWVVVLAVNETELTITKIHEHETPERMDEMVNVSPAPFKAHFLRHSGE